jgi:hypothetical protein
MEIMLLKGFANVNIPLNLVAVDFSGFPSLPAHRQQRRTIWRWESGPGRIDMGSHISVHGSEKLSIVARREGSAAGGVCRHHWG